MDEYNINLEEQKGSYSPRSDPKINNAFEHQKREQLGSSITEEPPSKLIQNKQNSSVIPTGITRFFRLQYYQQYFQVTQQEVLDRIKQSFIPFKTDFIQSLNNVPDFYGPFWLLTTIIFLASSTGNLSRYFYNWTKDAYIFKLELVRYAVLVVYSFGFQVPGVLYFVMKFLGVTKVGLPQMICIYGYSFSCFIPIFLLCIIPVPVLQWLLIAYGMINTSAFLILNLRAYLNEIEPPKMYLIFGLIVGAQVALFITFKLVFFKLVYQENTQSG